jgi:hypothetical protein
VHDLDMVSSMPIISDISWAKVVSCPCPWLWLPVIRTTVPVALTRTVAQIPTSQRRRTKRPTEVRRRDAAGLDIAGEAEPAQLALLLAGRAAFRFSKPA